MILGYKIRIYPTPTQEKLLWKHINSARFMWNYMLNLQETLYHNNQKHLDRFQMCKVISDMKKQDEYSWLNEVSNATLQKICTDLDFAYKRFYSKISNAPKFKTKKKSKPSFPVREEKERFYFKDNYVKIEKIGKILYKTNYKLPKDNVKYSNVRISYIHNKWILSFGIERENQTLKLSGRMGIDLGVKELAVVSYNGSPIVFHNINKSRRMKTLVSKLKHLQRIQCRKYRANSDNNGVNKSKSLIKYEDMIRDIHYKISNMRENYIHQITHYLISLYPERVVMEDLNVEGMRKNRYLAKAVQEECFSKFIFQMKYKCERNGIEFIQVDRFFPSSKLCHKCGNIKKKLKLSERTYVCEECGFTIDRDFNAALNLEYYDI